MCNLILTSTFNDFSNSPIEKSLIIEHWTCKINEYKAFNYNCQNILSIQINETYKTLSIEFKKDFLILHDLLQLKFIFLDLALKLYNPSSKLYFNYEDKSKYIINYEFLEWNNLNE